MRPRARAVQSSTRSGTQAPAETSTGAPTLVLVDGYSLLHRAFFALPMLATSAGEPTNAVYGFATMLVRLLEEERPRYAAVAVDRAGPTFRHRQYAAYKGHRPAMPDQLRPQLERFEELVAAFRIPMYGADGFEADDVIGTLTRQALEQDPDCRVVIVTGDRDALQLVDERVTVLLTRRGITDVVRFTPERVWEEYGITPGQVVDLKGLVGDPSDNIPGVPGIGEKSAIQLLQRYPRLEDALADMEQLPPRVEKALRQFGEQALLSRHLATIVTDAPVALDWEQSRLRAPDGDALARLLLELEFRSLLGRLARMYPQLRAAAGGRQAVASATAAPSTSPATPSGAAPAGAAPGSTAEAPGDGAPGPGPAHGSGGTRGGETWRVTPRAAPFAEPEVITTGERLQSYLTGVRQAGPACLLVAMDDEEPMRAAGLVIAVANDAGAFAVQAGDRWPAWAVPLAEWLEDPAADKWTHDAKSAAVALGRREVRLRGVVSDVMLASYLLHPGQGDHSLPDVAVRFLARYLGAEEGQPPQGGRRSSANQTILAPEWLEAIEGTAPPVPALGRWLRERLEVVYNLAPELERFLRQDGLEELYRTVELPLWPVLARMELAGVAIDAEVLRRLSGILQRDQERLEQEIYALAGERFNINSPRQLGHVLFERLKLPVLKQTKTGPSTSADVLEELAPEHEIVVKILDYRQLTKLRGTYVDALPALIHPQTGRLHTTFHQAVTATGRLSSANPNLQNIPVRTDQGAVVREAFVAGMPGWVLLSADYSQIELRILAHLSGDPALIDAFARGQDIHTRTASEVFGVPMEAVTTAMRSGAKAINFGIVYGISAYGLARGTGLSQDDARKYIDGYFQRYPGVKRYIDETVRRARETGYVTTLFGRRRYLPELHSRQYAQRSFAERMAMNTPIQGTAADIMKMAMIRVDRRLQEGGFQARIVLQVHDELVIELPEEEVAPVGAAVREAMEGVVSLSVPLVADVKAGRNWRECK